MNKRGYRKERFEYLFSSHNRQNPFYFYSFLFSYTPSGFRVTTHTQHAWFIESSRSLFLSFGVEPFQCLFSLSFVIFYSLFPEWRRSHAAGKLEASQTPDSVAIPFPRLEQTHWHVFPAVFLNTIRPSIYQRQYKGKRAPCTTYRRDGIQ